MKIKKKTHIQSPYPLIFLIKQTSWKRKPFTVDGAQHHIYLWAHDINSVFS